MLWKADELLWLSIQVYKIINKLKRQGAAIFFFWRWCVWLTLLVYLFSVTVSAWDVYSQIQRKNWVLKINIYSNSCSKKMQTLTALIALTWKHLKEVGMRNSALCSCLWYKRVTRPGENTQESTQLNSLLVKILTCLGSLIFILQVICRFLRLSYVIKPEAALRTYTGTWDSLP